MFNFTTQTVYNEVATTGANKNMWIASGKKPALRVGNTRFDGADILDVLIKKPSKESLASVTFDMTDIIPTKAGENTTGRIAIYVGLSMNSQDSFYANDYVYKGKPLYIEFPVSYGESADVVATRVKKIADKYLLFTAQEKILDVSVTATAAVGADPGPAADAVGTVTFTGVNGFQLIKHAVMLIWDPNATTVDCCTTNGAFVDVITGVPVVYTIDGTSGLAVAGSPAKKIDEDGNKVNLGAKEVAILPGLEAFGDYNWIIHNLRLPTAANTGFWAPTKGEMPIPGQVYTQFIVRILKERDGIMGEIVGARGTSVTTHVLYVAGDAALDGVTTTTAADKVYNAFFTASGLNLAGTKKKVDADTKLATPYGA